MRLQVDLAETVHGHEGVDLRGGHRRVPEQFLHHPHVGTALEEVGGVAVPQGALTIECELNGSNKDYLAKTRQYLQDLLDEK